VIVGLFSILTGKRCPDGRNHSDAEAQPVFNRTGEWDSVFLGYSVRANQPTRPRSLARDTQTVLLVLSILRGLVPRCLMSLARSLQRDGFHWYRPIDDNGRHRVFLPQDTSPVKCNADGSSCDWRWNKANVQSVGGGFVVPNDQVSGGPLRFYVGGRTGVDQLVGNGTAGFAELRRDVREPSRQTTSRQNRSAWQAILSCCCLYY
jgi:hypothetical protein